MDTYIPPLKPNMELLKLLPVSIVHGHHVVLQSSLECQQLNVCLTQQSGVHMRGGVVSGRGLPHGSSGVFSAEVVDVDEESVAMGTNHVPHFLIIETLILLQSRTHTQEREREMLEGARS